MQMRVIEEPQKTLFDQLNFSENEISDRLALVDIKEHDLEILREYKALLESRLHLIVFDFYSYQTEIEENALIIGDADTLSKLKAVQKNYILDIFEGVIDQEYVNNRLRIGLVHKRIGIGPKLYIPSVQSLKHHILKYLKPAMEEEDFSKLARALEKVLALDTSLVFDSYVNSMISEISIAKAKAEEYARSIEALSTRDSLTGLMNRRALDIHLKRLMAHSKRSNEAITCLVIDMNKFKYINDEFGHAKGDEVLVELGKTLLKATRVNVDIACRLGGDEFLVFLSNCKEEGAETFIERIEEDFSQKYPEFSFSIGYKVTGPDQYLSLDECMQQADKNMYQNKRDFQSVNTTGKEKLASISPH